MSDIFILMCIRKATVNDIVAMHTIRCAVRENVLRTPGLVTRADYEAMLLQGAAWVHELDSAITGFAIADIATRNIWALFVDPDHEGKGIGSSLHDIMIASCKDAGLASVWLSTAPGTRAAAFYSAKKWQHTDMLHSGDLKFEYYL